MIYQAQAQSRIDWLLKMIPTSVRSASPILIRKNSFKPAVLSPGKTETSVFLRYLAIMPHSNVVKKAVGRSSTPIESKAETGGK